MKNTEQALNFPNEHDLNHKQQRMIQKFKVEISGEITPYMDYEVNKAG